MAYKVVSVEDDSQIAELMCLVLSHAEIEVFTAHDGPEGLALIRSAKPDLVILDVMMPEMNGWAVFDTIRADEDLKTTPVIMVSVMPETSKRKREFAQSAIDCYFTKPFDPAEVLIKLKQMSNPLDQSSP